MSDDYRTTDLSMRLFIHQGYINGVWTRTVDARDLHQQLAVSTQFTAWITRRIAEYQFGEGTDYFYSHLDKKRGRPQDIYALTLDMAKELCMVERTAIGHQVRQYFLACEQALSTSVIAQGMEKLMARIGALEASSLPSPRIVPPQHQLPPPTVPSDRIETRVEVSLQMARVWHLLRHSTGWLSNAEIGQQAAVKARTVRTYTRYWLGLGLVECQEVFPRHLYRLSPLAVRQQTRLWQQLDTCTAILLQRDAKGY